MTTGQVGRRYRLEEVIGTGGFGVVYRGTLLADGDFEKPVAIKMLTAETPTEEALRRFRDEARVLGLLRDRAIVGVGPPTRLDGKLAVVMEYVEGVSLEQLRRAGVSFPPEVLLEIVGEVCRALDHAYTSRDAEGRKLAVIHRDLKPANLQLTRSGEVKILDFGIAKADFEAREHATTQGVVGTLGFIAPERFEGEESDRTDIFSMGAVLKMLLDRDYDPEDPLALQAHTLADEMASEDPGARPSAREVERRCERVSRKLGRVRLRQWAREHVRPQGEPAGQDERTGSVVAESRLELPTSGTSSEILAFGFLSSTSMGLLVAGVLALLAVLWWLRPTPLLLVELAHFPEPNVPAEYAEADLKLLAETERLGGQRLRAFDVLDTDHATLVHLYRIGSAGAFSELVLDMDYIRANRARTKHLDHTVLYAVDPDPPIDTWPTSQILLLWVLHTEAGADPAPVRAAAELVTEAAASEGLADELSWMNVERDDIAGLLVLQVGDRAGLQAAMQSGALSSAIAGLDALTTERETFWMRAR